MSTLYIHIGTPKTGTTSIQNFLMENVTQLENNGICFPYMNLAFPKKKYKNRRNGHFLVYRSSLPEESDRKAEEDRIYHEGFEIIKKHAETAQKIIVTDEAIWYRQNHRKTFWQDIVADAKSFGCDVKVVVYLRRQDLYVQSLWNQSIKFYPRITCDFSEYLEHRLLQSHNLDYYQQLCKIANAIGKENLIVHVYEKKHLLNSSTGIFGDFMEAVSEEMDSAYTIPEVEHNLNINGNYIEIKKIINESPSYLAEDDFLSDLIGQASNIEKQEKNSYFSSYEEQMAYLQQFENSNSMVAKEFLGFSNGVLFSEPVEPLPKLEIHSETMYKDIIRMYTETVVAQYREINNLKKKMAQRDADYKELKKRVRQLEKNDKPHLVRYGKKLIKK